MHPFRYSCSFCWWLSLDRPFSFLASHWSFFLPPSFLPTMTPKSPLHLTLSHFLVLFFTNGYTTAISLFRGNLFISFCRLLLLSFCEKRFTSPFFMRHPESQVALHWNALHSVKRCSLAFLSKEIIGIKYMPFEWESDSRVEPRKNDEPRRTGSHSSEVLSP